MGHEDLLLALTSYPQATPLPAIEEAVEIASALGARISALAAQVRFPPSGNRLAERALGLKAMMEDESAKSLANAQAMLAHVKDHAERHKCFGASILERVLAAELPRRFAHYARLRDLTLVPVPEGEWFDQWLAETIIFESGRPVLVLPHSRRGRPALKRIVVAWDFGRAASRALADAMAILAQASEIHVLTVSEDGSDLFHPAAQIKGALRRRGLSCVTETLKNADASVSTVLDARIRALDPDLLVMGAYGHPRLREFILGGVTRDMLAKPPAPILLSH